MDRVRLGLGSGPRLGLGLGSGSGSGSVEHLDRVRRVRLDGDVPAAPPCDTWGGLAHIDRASHLPTMGLEPKTRERAQGRR